MLYEEIWYVKYRQFSNKFGTQRLSERNSIIRLKNKRLEECDTKFMLLVKGHLYFMVMVDISIGPSGETLIEMEKLYISNHCEKEIKMAVIWLH